MRGQRGPGVARTVPTELSFFDEQGDGVVQFRKWELHLIRDSDDGTLYAFWRGVEAKFLRVVDVGMA